MIKEFIKFVSELFPSISPYTKENVINAIKQFETDRLEWFLPSKLNYLAQGDIIEKLPFQFVDENGNLTPIMAKGIILSNTCDIDHDDNIVIAPMFNYENILDEQGKQTARANKYYDKMCFTNSQIDNMFVDFTKAMTFNRNLIEKLLESKTKVEYSLNQYGYYLLISKLTVYFLRPEDEKTNALRDDKIEEKIMQNA